MVCGRFCACCALQPHRRLTSPGLTLSHSPAQTSTLAYFQHLYLQLPPLPTLINYQIPKVRKAWMKANLLVHPDKVRQRNGGDEQVAIADMIFDALKEAWGQFRG